MPQLTTIRRKREGCEHQRRIGCAANGMRLSESHLLEHVMRYLRSR